MGTKPDEPLIFISCGQVTKEEKQLGQAVRDLVEEITPFRGYFAENQMDLDGLTNHIFRNLKRCHGLIAVMHERGKVTGLNRRHWTRGSVWIEQEIAIAAFMTHVLQRPLRVALFTKPGIRLEGAREKLMLNAITFDIESEVLNQLREMLPTWTPIDEKPTYDMKYRYKWYATKTDPNLHEYRLVFYVKNSGSSRASDYRLEVNFPTAFLNDTEESSGHRSFFFSQDQFNGGRQIMYPDEEREAFRIDYYVDSRNWEPPMLKKVVKIMLRSGDMPLKTEEISMHNLQDF
jgi:hypothetical protein